MPLLIGLGVGAAAGVAKYELVDQPQYERKKKLAASTQRYSPWTGMKAEAPNEPNAVGDVMQYGTQGAMMGQGVGNAQSAQDLQSAQTQWLNQNPYNYQTGATNSMGNPAAGQISGLNYNQNPNQFWGVNPWGNNG